MTVLYRFFPESNDDKEVTLNVVEQVTIDAKGRVRVEVDGQSFRHGEEIEVYPHKSLGVYDGQVMKSMSGRQNYTHGLITSSRGDVGLRMDPWSVTTHYFSKPISEILAEKSAFVADRVEWKGKQVLRVQTKPTVNKTDSRKYVFLIDPAMNYAVVKRAIAIQFEGQERWMEYTRIVGEDFFEAHPGIWVPKRVVHESFAPTLEDAKKGAKPALSWRWDIRMDDWKINPEVPDAVFELDFDPGLYINDKIAGRSFQT
jgi:hypothetical protein